MGFPRLEYSGGLPFPSPGGLPDPGIELGSPALQAESLPSEPSGKPLKEIILNLEIGGQRVDDEHAAPQHEKSKGAPEVSRGLRFRGEGNSGYPGREEEHLGLSPAKSTDYRP